ncbi:MAG: ATP-binding protein [Actinomycetota bacterium]|nr:ATP-binding protein [Actinomycetota bacterium]
MNDDDLLEFVEDVSADGRFKIEEDLGSGFVRLNVSEAEKRQAKHDIRCFEDVVIELIRNSRDSGSKNIFISSNREGNERRLVIIDDGCGIPPDLLNLVFEPRVTSKLDTIVEDKYGIHGRGMALYSIRNNVSEIDILASGLGRGTFFRVVNDIKKLPEKKDQSTLPLTRLKNGQVVVVKGPRNISRTVIEFALEHQEINLFFGTASQILATIYDLSQNLLTHQKCGESIFYDSFSKGELPLWQCLGMIGDSKSLMDAALNSYGLSVSLRNIHRVFAGEIEPLSDIRSSLFKRHRRRLPELGTDTILFNNRNLASYIERDDLDKLARALEAEFESISEKYFVKSLGTPKVRREKNRLNFVLELIDQDDE